MIRLLKSCFALIILFTVVANGNAQTTSGRFSVQLSVGAAVPVGRFGKKTYSYKPDSSFGLAKPGPVLALKANYLLGKRFSVSFLASGMLNREDKKAFEGGGYNTPNASTYIKVRSWKTLSLMAGAGYALPIGNKEKGLLLIPSLYMGMMKTSFPGDSVAYHSDRPGSGNDFIYAMWRDKLSMRWAFCYQASATVQYPVSKILQLDAGVDFFDSDILTPVKYPHDPRQFKISTINILVGIGMRF